MLFFTSRNSPIAILGCGMICLAMLCGCGDNQPSRPYDSGLDDGIVGTITDAAGDPVAGAAVCLVFACELCDRFAKPTTTISFELPEEGEITVKVLDLRGDVVRTLVDGELPAGTYTVMWDSRDDSGRLVPNGLYEYYVKSAGEGVDRMTMLLSSPDLGTLFERANAVSDENGYYRIPRDLIPVGAAVECWPGEEGSDNVVSPDLTLQVARMSESGIGYKFIPATLAVNQDRLVVDITLH